MSIRKKVGILFTGGTISMTIDKEIGANVPTLSGEQIMSMATNVKDVADFEIKDFDEIPGPHMTPDKLIQLKHCVLDLLNRDDICGVVITHGTDSLEESAYFLDLVINHEKPVIVTGAMRSSSELGYDGSNNLSSAICVAISENAKNKGVLVVTLIDVGHGKTKPEALKEMLEAKNRTAACDTAPAKGLYLLDVQY